MCNINAIWINKNNTKLNSFLIAVTSNSFADNSHGEGVYFSSDNSVIKSKDKIDYLDYNSQIDNSKLIITHQRYSTSGFEVKYNHPFENKDFILVHNGIINQFKELDGSDTFGFFNKFVNKFNNIKTHTSRECKIVSILKKLFNTDDGSYSIIIYDKKTKVNYYFKNTPEINFYINDNILFVTTNSNNKIFLSLLGNIKFKKLDIKPREIYKIINGDKIHVYKIDTLPEIKTTINQIDLNTICYYNYYY